MNAIHSLVASPAPTALTTRFWEACRKHRLVVQRCNSCDHLRFYPTAGCPACACDDFTWDEMSGKGRLYSWTVVHRSVDPYWQTKTPFVSAIIELDEQPGLLVPGLLTDVATEQLRAGQPLTVWFEEAGEFTLPRWRPAPSANSLEGDCEDSGRSSIASIP